MEAYFSAKQKAVRPRALKDTAIAITNADDDPEWLPIVYKYRCEQFVYTMAFAIKANRHKPIFWRMDVAYSTESTKFRIEKRYSDERAIFESPLAGKINVENVLAAASALYFGIEGFSLDVLAGLIPEIQPVRGRF